MYCPSTSATASAVSNHFPLAAALAASNRMMGGGPAGGGGDRGMDTDAALPYAVRRAVGEALGGSPGAVAAVLEWAQQPSMGGGSGAAGAAPNKVQRRGGGVCAWGSRAGPLPSCRHRHMLEGVINMRAIDSEFWP